MSNGFLIGKGKFTFKMIPYISFSGVFVFVYGLHRDGNIELLKAAGYVGRINHLTSPCHSVDYIIAGIRSSVCIMHCIPR